MAECSFHLTVPVICPVAQTVQIALALRGALAGCAVRDGAVTQFSLRDDRGVAVHLTAPLAIVEAIEDLHPDRPLYPAGIAARAQHRDMIGLCLRVQQLLSIVTRARLTADLHIAVLHLRTELARVERLLASGSYVHGRDFTNVDVVFAPTLWRMRLLDLRCSTFLLSGFPQLAAWARWISGHEALRPVLSQAALQTYLAELARRGAALASPAQAEAWRPITHAASHCGLAN